MGEGDTDARAEGVALVTGATGGIGRAIARALARRGTPALLTSRRIEAAEALGRELTEETGTPCRGVALDVADPASVAALPGAIADFGRVGWLVNNAGIAETAPCHRDANGPLAQRLMEVNFFGPLRLFALFGPAMVEAGAGRVVQIASSASLKGYPYVSAYAASKHALLGWTRSAGLELAPKGVGVSAVCPHYVDTPLTDRSIEAMKEKTGRDEGDLRSFVASQNPGGVLVTPDEVADATLDLIVEDRGGVVVELVGGGSRVVDEGVALSPDTEAR